MISKEFVLYLDLQALRYLNSQKKLSFSMENGWSSCKRIILSKHRAGTYGLSTFTYSTQRVFGFNQLKQRMCFKHSFWNFGEWTSTRTCIIFSFQRHSSMSYQHILCDHVIMRITSQRHTWSRLGMTRQFQWQRINSIGQVWVQMWHSCSAMSHLSSS